MSTIKKCNWCKEKFEEVEGEKKRYCDDCGAKCKKECKACHKPYPNLKYYNSSHDKRCSSCAKKYENQAQSRKQKKLALENIEAYNASKRGGRRNPQEGDVEEVSEYDSQPLASCLDDFSEDEEKMPPVEEIESDQLVSDLIVDETDQEEKKRKKSPKKRKAAELEGDSLVSDISKSSVKEICQPRKKSKKQIDIFDIFESEKDVKGKKENSAKAKKNRDKSKGGNTVLKRKDCFFSFYLG